MSRHHREGCGFPVVTFYAPQIVCRVHDKSLPLCHTGSRSCSLVVATVKVLAYLLVWARVKLRLAASRAWGATLPGPDELLLGVQVFPNP